jgi:serine/threonine protein kinase
MAPELFDGKTATKQSDRWALGVVLYEIHELRRPFESIAEICRGKYEEF